MRCWISSLSCRPGHEWQSSGVHGVREGWEGDWGEVVGGAGGLEPLRHMLPRFELVSFLEAAAAARRWREGAANHQDGGG